MTTIRKAVETAYSGLGKTFSPYNITDIVKTIMLPRRPMDGTILRRLRELRRDEIIDYVCKDGEYRKKQKCKTCMKFFTPSEKREPESLCPECMIIFE